MVLCLSKLKKSKLWVILLAAAVVAALLLLPGKSEAEDAEKIETNEQRIAFLSDFGWEVKEDPAETQEIRIPESEDAVFQRYNELQKSQGYDLSQYAGECVHRYVYEITNYPGDDATHYATMLIHRGEVIGGDVASSEKDGAMHGFAMPH